VAFGVIVAFALFGRTILDDLGVGLPALEGPAACSCRVSRWSSTGC